ncbi:MAG: hypothetical protein ACT4P4_26785 [Betaproteobacteria bacterium]
MQYSIEADAEFLRVKMSGRESNAPPSHVCAAIFRQASKLDLKRILIELDQKTPLSASSQYTLISRLPQIGFTPKHRIAMVHRTPEMQKANEFIDVVADNRGLQVRSFPTVESAEAWLRDG